MKAAWMGIIAAGALMVAGTASAQSPEELAKKDGCLACHAVDKKIVGPSYQDVAKKYAGQADAAAKLEKKVKEGGKGVWGEIPMPPNSAVSEADIKVLVKWILSQK
jgi:cytochrome c